MSDPTEQKIIALIAAIKKLPPERVTAASTFEELGLDSLDRMNLLFEIEGEFDISIPDEQARAIRSVSQAVEGVRGLLTRTQA